MPYNSTTVVLVFETIIGNIDNLSTILSTQPDEYALIGQPKRKNGSVLWEKNVWKKKWQVEKNDITHQLLNIAEILDESDELKAYIDAESIMLHVYCCQHGSKSDFLIPSLLLSRLTFYRGFVSVEGY